VELTLSLKRNSDEERLKNRGRCTAELVRARIAGVELTAVAGRGRKENHANTDTKQAEGRALGTLGNARGTSGAVASVVLLEPFDEMNLIHSSLLSE